MYNLIYEGPYVFSSILLIFTCTICEMINHENSWLRFKRSVANGFKVEIIWSLSITLQWMAYMVDCSFQLCLINALGDVDSGHLSEKARLSLKNVFQRNENNR